MSVRWRRFRGLFGPDPRGDVEDELSFHMEMRIRELVERGESPARARELALRRFGSVEDARSECEAVSERLRRRVLRTEFFDERKQDVRYALRTLLRAPGYTAVAVLTLALGIGANTAIFSLFSELILRPLPVDEPQHLVNIVSPGPRSGPTSCGGIGKCDGVFSYPMFRDLERIQAVFTGVAAHRDIEVNLTHSGQSTTGQGLLVSGNYFPVLRLQPALGRLLAPHDDRTIGGSDVVVLSHSYWQRQFGGRTDVLDEPLLVNGQPMTVIGVTPEDFSGTSVGLRPDVFLPITMRWRLAPDPRSPPENRRAYWIYLFARLRPGVTLDHARHALDVPYRAIINDVELPLQEGMSDQMMAQFRARGIGLESGSRGQSRSAEDGRVPFTLLLAVTALVLLIACSNVANLLLARAASRAKELATRLSIGATRGRIVAQLLTESCVLAFIAATVSLVVARGTMDLFRTTLPDGALYIPAQLDAFTLIITGALALFASVAVGLFPALHATRPELLPGLKGQSGQPSGGRGLTRSRKSLATVQVMLSVMLVVLAGLFTKSLANMTRVDPGLDTDGVVTFALSPGRNGYTPQRSAALFARVEEEIAALPGVTAVATSTTRTLFSGDTRATEVLVEGVDVRPEADHGTQYDEIGPGYFRTLGVPLIAGREFTSADTEHAPKVAIVNEAFARRFGFAGEGVGKRTSRGTAGFDVQVVGVVRDFKHTTLRSAGSMYFVPHRQATRRPGLMTFYVRTAASVEGIAPTIRDAVRRVDTNLPVEELRTLEEAMRGGTTRERLMSVMTGAFAILATLVAAIGLYGMMAYAVAQRTPEIGLRMALGATRGSVRWMILRQVLVVAAVGAAIGLIAAMLLGRTAQTLLFELQFHDPIVLAGSILALMLVAVAAGVVPADRAARVDPISALKYE